MNTYFFYMDGSERRWAIYEVREDEPCGRVVQTSHINHMWTGSIHKAALDPEQNKDLDSFVGEANTLEEFKEKCGHELMLALL